MKGKIGKTQIRFMDAMRKHGPWWFGCGWVWVGRATTVKLCEQLVRRGLVWKGVHRFHGMEVDKYDLL